MAHLEVEMRGALGFVALLRLGLMALATWQLFVQLPEQDVPSVVGLNCCQWHRRMSPSFDACDQQCGDQDGKHADRPPPKVAQVPALTSIFFAGVQASGVFGNVTVKTPFLTLASIFSRSTP